MSLFYKILYQVGFTPWEDGLAQASVADQIFTMFDCEEAERPPPYGRALDLGCGSGIHAVEPAKPGWQALITGVVQNKRLINILLSGRFLFRTFAY